MNTLTQVTKVPTFKSCVETLHSAYSVNARVQVAIMFHADCMDGSGSLYAAKTGLMNAGVKEEDIQEIPCEYGKRPFIIWDPDALFRFFFVVDFSFPKETLENWSRFAVCIVLDHHKTAQEMLKDYPLAIFDMNKSGAVLSWEYFHPGEEIPESLKLIEDRDLWRWQYKERTEQFSAYFSLKKTGFQLAKEAIENVENSIAAGKSISEYIQKEVSFLVGLEGSKVRYLEIDNGWIAGIINATAIQSEIGNKICQTPIPGSDGTRFPDLAIIWALSSEGKLKLSLRSVKDGPIDVSVLAKKWGGGGHASSSGADNAPIELLKLWYGELS